MENQTFLHFCLKNEQICITVREMNKMIIFVHLAANGAKSLDFNGKSVYNKNQSDRTGLR